MYRRQSRMRDENQIVLYAIDIDVEKIPMGHKSGDLVEVQP